MPGDNKAKEWRDAVASQGVLSNHDHNLQPGRGKEVSEREYIPADTLTLAFYALKLWENKLLFKK